MGTKRPVLCPNCGAQIRKDGYCSACYMNINVLRKAFNTSNYYYNIAYDKAVARDLSGAIDALNTSLRYNKKNIMSRNLLGLIYYEMGEVVMALSQFVLSVNYQSNNNLASRYLKELRQDPTRLSEIDQIAIKFNMALGYCYSNDYDLAIMQLRSVLAANPHFVQGYLLLALLFIEINNYEKARTTLKRVLKIDKANPVAIHFLHEMGVTEENIIQMRMETMENDGLFEEDYLSEELAIAEETSKNSGNVATKILAEIKTKVIDNSAKNTEYGEIKFSKYSGVYVFVGLVLGILLLFFVVVPNQKKKLRVENDELIKSYSEEIANKNATISTLNSEISRLNQQIDDMLSSNDGEDIPDYSQIQSGMSEEDIQNMIKNE